MNAYGLSELDRMQANMVRYGVVIELDAANARVKCSTGGLETDWLPWCAGRAGATRKWSAPRPGEQVVVISPYGDPAQAFVLPGFYQDDHPAPASSQDKETTVYPDGSTSEHDSAAKSYTYTVPAGGKITLQVGSTSLVLEDGKATLTAAQFEHKGDAATFDGMATVKKLLSWLSGVSGKAGSDGGANAIDGGVNVVNGDVTADNISLKGHGHIEQGDGNRTSNSVP
jgi:phage baseplate assembly protein V